jgi:hypothetical protein
MLSVIDIMLSAIMLSVIMLGVIMLSFIMLSVIILRVIMLIVVSPNESPLNCYGKLLALPANIKLRWKWMPMANTPA